MYGMYFLFVVFLYCNLLQLTKVEGLLLPFLYIHTCVIFNKCIQTLKKKYYNVHRWWPESKIQTSDTDITIVRSTVNCASQADNVNVSCEDTT